MSEILGALFIIFIVATMQPHVRRFIGALLLIAIVLATVGVFTGSHHFW